MERVYEIWKEKLDEFDIKFPALFKEINCPEMLGLENFMNIAGDPDLCGYGYMDKSQLIDLYGKVVLLEYDKSLKFLFPARVIEQKRNTKELIEYLLPGISFQLSMNDLDHVKSLKAIPDVINYLFPILNG